MQPGAACLRHLIETAIADWGAIAPPGTAIAVVVAVPGSPLSVYSPGGQNPAATYGSLRHALANHADNIS